MSNDAGLKLVPPPGAPIDDGRIHLPFGLSYTTEELTRDLVAGLTVAAISLPQAMAYALLAGVDPRYGLYSAIVVTAVASIFGSSSHLINGPTSAISLVVFASLGFLDPEQKGRSRRGDVPAWRDGRVDSDSGCGFQARRPHTLHFGIGDPWIYDGGVGAASRQSDQ